MKNKETFPSVSATPDVKSEEQGNGGTLTQAEINALFAEYDNINNELKAKEADEKDNSDTLTQAEINALFAEYDNINNELKEAERDEKEARYNQIIAEHQNDVADSSKEASSLSRYDKYDEDDEFIPDSVERIGDDDDYIPFMTEEEMEDVRKSWEDYRPNIEKMNKIGAFSTPQGRGIRPMPGSKNLYILEDQGVNENKDKASSPADPYRNGKIDKFLSAMGLNIPVDKKDENLRTNKDNLAQSHGDKLTGAKEDELARARAEEVSRIMAEESARASQPDSSRTNQAKNAEPMDIASLLERNRAIDEELAILNQELSHSNSATFNSSSTHLDPAPLVAINSDWTHDKREIAHDLAEQALNSELESAKGLSGAIKRIWKGTYLRKYFTEKYYTEYMKGSRRDESGRTVSDIIREQKNDVIARFTMGVVEGNVSVSNNNGFIHEKAGESLKVADEKTNEQVKYAIEQYARYKFKLGDKQSNIDRKFRDSMARIMQEAIDDGRMNEGAKYTNYLEVAKEAAYRYQELAINARNKAEQDSAMAEVMAGFKVYNAEVRNGVRTKAHRDNIDKIVSSIESSKIGRFIPQEVLAGGLGAAFALTQTGARAILGAAGGIIASSAVAGLRERNRLVEDRTRMLRDAADGLDYVGQHTAEEDLGDLRGRAKKTAKYEKRLGGTLYDMKKASDLTARIEEAMKYTGENPGKVLMEAIAEARVRIDLSDSESKDLISYSSAENRGKERLALDIALVQAEKHLNEKGKKDYKIMQRVITDEIYDGYTDKNGLYHDGIIDKDADFQKFRTLAAVKKAGKTLAFGTAFFLGSQELMALRDPAKIGLAEKFGWVKTENSSDAEETILASGFGLRRGAYEGPNGEFTEDPVASNVSDPDKIAEYEASGYNKSLVSEAYTSQETTITEVDPADSLNQIDVKYDGWASSGTRAASGNELRAYYENGSIVSGIRGTSVLVNGQTVNYDPNSLKAFITVGGAKYEIASHLNEAGQLTWGEGGVFTTATGETIKAISDTGEKLYQYFEIAIDNGTDVADGLRHIIPLATDVGNNNFMGKIQQVIEETVEHPAVYNFTRTVPLSSTFVRGVSFSGLSIPPLLSGPSLGGASRERRAA